MNQLTSAPDFAQPAVFLLTILVCAAVVVFRYLLVAGTFYFIFYVWNPRKYQHRKINSKPYPKGQFRKEVGWSLITSFIFGVTGALVALGWQKGLFKIYPNLSAFPVWYFPLSILLAMLIQETYYYWLHRLMHHRLIYKKVHQVHHDSLIASPWTSFSFHPLEAFFQAIIFPVLLLFLPMHPVAVIVYLSIMTITSAINHLDVEVYPQNFHAHSVGKWLIGATHHSLHHKQFRYNFGLYFTFWDKWMKTESPFFQPLFKEKTSHYNTSQQGK